MGDLELTEPEEIIGLRKFAELVGVKLSSIQKAIGVGRITSVLHTRNGRKLLREPALVEWNASRVVGNNNRSGELEGDIAEAVAAAGQRSPDGLTWGMQKTKAEAFLAIARCRMIELERKELECLLHRAEDVEAVWTAILNRIRTRMLGIPTKAALIVVAEIGAGDPAQVRDILDGCVREALLELAGHGEEQIKAQAARRTGKRR